MKRNKKLHLYFERLRHMTELNMVRFYYRDESSAVHVEAGLTVDLLVQEEREHSWEIVRRRITSFMNQLEFFSFLSH